MIGSIVRVTEKGFGHWQGLRKLNPDREAWVGKVVYVHRGGAISTDFTDVTIDERWKNLLHNCKDTVPSKKGYHLSPGEFEIVDLKKVNLEDLL